MYNSINIDLVVERVKNIVNNNRCAICDKTDGTFMRYPCGHTSCDECATVAEDCSICLTPLQQSSSKTLVPDELLTLRVKNAATLLNACQDVFHTDVYRRKRISDKLKVEKELFPKCIQAPLKYSNKRKSINTSFKNKENRPSFSGETILSSKEKKMENSFNYVKQWLNSNEKNISRKPFTDLNTNEQRLCRDTRVLRHKPDIVSNKVKNTENIFSQNTNRKRSHFETTQQIAKSQFHILGKHLNLGKKVKRSKKVKKKIEKYKEETNNDIETGNDNDESGIVIDDEAVVIDDSQSLVIDKDKNAWLAVLEADKHQPNDTASVIRLDSGLTANSIVEKTFVDNNEFVTKVPFYKKSYLLETCKYCDDDFGDSKQGASPTDQSNKVSITIETDSFTTIIDVTKNLPATSTYDRHSISVQTDISESFVLNSGIKESQPDDEKDDKIDLQIEEEKLANVKCNACSQDIFTDEGKMLENRTEKKIETTLKSHNTVDGTKCLIIDESDSDEDMEGRCSLEVTADIHRSCDESEYGILTEVENQEELRNRTKRGARGLTPTSTDSSEKENFDPNRIKKTKFGKKTCIKK